jgi:Protein of unknown function (DUF2997)
MMRREMKRTMNIRGTLLLLLLLLNKFGSSLVKSFHIVPPTFPFVALSKSTREQSTMKQTSSFLSMNADSWNAPATSGGAIERIEFKIYPDGRVEETVRGIKGNNCHKVTEKINEALGSVVASTPTEEMYEQSVIVTETISLSNGWDGSSSW